MTGTRFFVEDHRRGLSQALKAVRRLRQRTAADVAAAMGLPLRSYQHFEAGAGRFDFEKVLAFAEALDADPFGILAAVQIGSPRFAARVADNKMMMALMMRLEEFDQTQGDALSRIGPAEAMAEIGEAFRRLEVRRPPFP